MWKTVCLTNMVPQFPPTINQLFFTSKYIYVYIYNIMYWCIGELNKLYCIVLYCILLIDTYVHIGDAQMCRVCTWFIWMHISTGLSEDLLPAPCDRTVPVR